MGEHLMKDVKSVLASAEPNVQKLIAKILQYESEFKHQKSLSNDNVSELCKRIIKLIDQEVT